MSTHTCHHPVRPAAVNRCCRAPRCQPTNGLAVAGFVVSLASLLTCGLASPVGLLLSLGALGKRPRGLALAGVLISTAQVALLAGAVLLAVWTGQAVQENYENVAKTEQTRQALVEARQVVRQHVGAHEQLPGELEGNKLVVPFEDGWGEALRFEYRGEGYLIRSAGPDGDFETADDLTLSNSSPAGTELPHPSEMPPIPEIRIR